MPPEGVASKEAAIIGAEEIRQHLDCEAPRETSPGHMEGNGPLQPSDDGKGELDATPGLGEVPDPQAEGSSRARGPRDNAAPQTAEAPDGSEVPTTAPAAKGPMGPGSRARRGDAQKGQPGPGYFTDK